MANKEKTSKSVEKKGENENGKKIEKMLEDLKHKSARDIASHPCSVLSYTLATTVIQTAERRVRYTADSVINVEFGDKNVIINTYPGGYEEVSSKEGPEQGLE